MHAVCSETSLELSIMSGRFSRTIYVGNLPLDIREYEVEDLFYKVWFKFCQFTILC